MEREIWTVKQVAFYLRINPKTVYEMVNSGELPAFKVGGSWRFKKADIKQWVDERKKLCSRNVRKDLTEGKDKGGS